MSVEDKLRSFIVDDLQAEVPREQLTDDFALIDEKVIDSMGIYQLVTFVESEFGVEVLDEELLPENFATIGAVTRLIDSKKST